MGIRVKLFVLTLGLIAVADFMVGIYLERELRSSLQDRMWNELVRHARSARALLEATPDSATVEGADRAADRAGEASSARITIVDVEGTVIGDSAFEPAALRGLGSHAHRPEILQVFSSGQGDASRFSTTMREEMLYAAVLLEQDGVPLAVRAALPGRRMEEAIGRMRRAVALAGLVSLMVAGFLLVLASQLVSSTLRAVVSTAHAVAGPRSGGSEDSQGGSLSQLAAELERALAMLAAERNRFEAVLQTMDQAVLALDARQRLTTINRAGRQLLGLRDEVEGLTLLEAVRVPALKELVELAEPGVAKSAEFDIPGGRRVEARATMQPDGGIVVVILDVTEVRRLERVRRDFVANVSHELRTPISVIRANTETLLEGGLEDPVRSRQFVEAVLRHSERLGRLVSDLLDISRIEAGRYPLTPQEIVVADAVDHVLDSVEVDAQKKRIDLAVDVDPDLELEVDRKALEHVLINLVSNAVKYTPEGGHVEVTVTRQGDRVRFEVLDDGPGIDPAHRERIFERFYRVDPGRSRDMGGTGLGLSIVKHLVEVMDGEVGVNPRSPKGSVFWFTLGGLPGTARRGSGPPRPASPGIPDTSA